MLVVFAVIALKAVIAREIALQRRQNRDAQRLGVVARAGEKFVQRLAVGVAARDDEPVVGQRDERLALVVSVAAGLERRRIILQTIEQACNIGPDD
jgi:hypothetical protein